MPLSNKAVARMKAVWRWAQLSIMTGILLSNPIHAQELTPEQAADPTIAAPPNRNATFQQPVIPHTNAPLYRDLDLLRRGGFADAREAMVSLRILTKDVRSPAAIKAGEYTLIVNGTPRESRLHAPGSSAIKAIPLVLLVFPPNDPTVHFIGIREAKKYFSKQPEELLPWKVGILDSDGKMSPFTDGRSQLLVNLDVIDHTNEPFQYTTGAMFSGDHRWEGSWLTKAEDAIAVMQSFEAPR